MGYKNFLTENVVLVSPKRDERPTNFKKMKHKKSEDTSNCSFCICNSHTLTKPLYESDDKSCRIVLNKYPFCIGENCTNEVVIDTLDHSKMFHETDLSQMISVIKGLIAREKIHFENENVKTVAIFKNEGQDAGMSLEHSHTQIAVIDFVPPRIENISNNFTKYKIENKDNNCYICSLKENIDKFTFYENDSFFACTRFDTVMQNTIDIIPKRHLNKLSDFTDCEISDYCKCLKEVTCKVLTLFDNPSFNVLYNSSPRIDDKFNDDFHFFVQIIPRYGQFAGFELLTNCFVTSSSPFELAEMLKNIKLI